MRQDEPGRPCSYEPPVLRQCTAPPQDAKADFGNGANLRAVGLRPVDPSERTAGDGQYIGREAGRDGTTTCCEHARRRVDGIDAKRQAWISY